MTRPGIEPRSPGPLANTLLIRLLAYVQIELLVLESNNYNYLTVSK